MIFKTTFLFSQNQRSIVLHIKQILEWIYEKFWDNISNELTFEKTFPSDECNEIFFLFLKISKKRFITI